MREAPRRAMWIRAAAVAAFVLSLSTAGRLLAQTVPGAGPAGSAVRRLSVDDAVRLALEQNLGIQIDRLTPRIRDISVAQAKTGWIPSITSTLGSTSQNQPSTSALSGGQTKITDTQFSTGFGVSQTLRTGGNYSLTWNSGRSTSTNVFANFEPLLNSNVSFSVTQPLLRNYRIDNLRQTLESTVKDREAADVQLQATTILTIRNVKNAYWELAYQIDSLKAQQQSLDLARRLLADNEKRVQIGTMAPIDIVEAQSEVARNEESVIVAEAAIEQAEDRLRALIFNPDMPDFWNVSIEPTEPMAFTAQAVDTDDAVRRAIANRTDVQTSKNALAKTDIGIRYFRNQTLPDVSAQASYRSNAVGGTVLSPVSLTAVGAPRTIVSERGFGSVLGDVFTSAFPTWTFGVTVAYPIGNSSSEASLALAKLQYSQAQAQLKNLELQIATQVRDVARQMTTNQKRVASARAARELAERRLDAEQRKFTAGIQASFFVLQAQRDLTQALTAEIRAVADFNKSRVDFEAIQETAIQ